MNIRVNLAVFQMQRKLPKKSDRHKILCSYIMNPSCDFGYGVQDALEKKKFFEYNEIVTGEET